MKDSDKTQSLLDRVAIKDVIDGYARHADTRDAAAQMGLFTEDCLFKVYYDPKAETPSQTVAGRKNLAPVFEQLNAYKATMHFNGLTTFLSLDASVAETITYCMAHHLTVIGDVQRFMVAAIRYHDNFVRVGKQWLFAERKLFVDWIENS